jgi:hypothetical protein
LRWLTWAKLLDFLTPLLPGKLGRFLLSVFVLMIDFSGGTISADGTGPIYVCTRNDALKSVIDNCPPNRRGDLVFYGQNGYIEEFLRKEGLFGQVTQVSPSKLPQLFHMSLSQTRAESASGCSPGCFSAISRYSVTFSCGISYALRQVLVYMAVAKKGDKPTDGITDRNPEGLTAATGKWAPQVEPAPPRACGESGR